MAIVCKAKNIPAGRALQVIDNGIYNGGNPPVEFFHLQQEFQFTTDTIKKHFFISWPGIHTILCTFLKVNWMGRIWCHIMWAQSGQKQMVNRKQKQPFLVNHSVILTLQFLGVQGFLTSLNIHFILQGRLIFPLRRGKSTPRAVYYFFKKIIQPTKKPENTVLVLGTFPSRNTHIYT